MKAEIISIGTEILLGDITDTNSSYLAGLLPLLGIDLYWISAVGDNRRRLVETLRRAWSRSDLILTTGGLGPTEDDVTREAIAEMLGEEMVVDPELEQQLRGFFSRLGRQMPESNIKQATLIPSARAIFNPRGTAPGWWVEREGRVIVAMPGPPMELQRMWEREIAPELQKRLEGTIIKSRTLKTWGIGEGTLDEMISPLLSSTNPTIGVYAKNDGVHVRLTAKAESPEKVETMLSHQETEVRSILGDSIWGADDDILEYMVGDLLTQKGLSLATMESCTGGLLANILTDVPGSSAYFKGGLVSYSTETKIAWGVDRSLVERYGVVSPEVAQAMAEVARRHLEADIGVGITGVAGPDEMEGKPAGTVHFALASGNEKRVFQNRHPGTRLVVKRRAALSSLIELKRLLLSLK